MSEWDDILDVFHASETLVGAGFQLEPVDAGLLFQRGGHAVGLIQLDSGCLSFIQAGYNEATFSCVTGVEMVARLEGIVRGRRCDVGGSWPSG